MLPGPDKRFLEPIRLTVVIPVFNERFLVEASVRRVLSFTDPRVREIEVIVVDDGSTDGTSTILETLAAQEPRMRLVRSPENRGKGAAVRTGIREATGDLTVLQDADLEYDPADFAKLLRPFFELDADAVYGSRFMASDYRRVLYYRHELGNRLLTTLSNLATDLNLSDMETCYKMVRTELLKSIPLRADDFTVEPELTAKLAKRGAVLYEVPISYAGRTYQEGKKIRAVDGLHAIGAIVRWRMQDDLYAHDPYGSAILTSLNHVHRFNQWTADFLAADVGSRVLEIGAGIGNLSIRLLPRSRYVATDINPDYLTYLKNLAIGRPYLEARRLDLADAEGFEALAGQFDTVICLNVLEHVEDDVGALRNLGRALAPGGKALVLVPQSERLYSSLDEVLGHVRRYDRATLTSRAEAAGLRVERMRDFNRVGVPAWLLNGKLLSRKHFSSVQLKVLNVLTPAFRLVDDLLPWHGLSLVATLTHAEDRR